MKKTIPYLALLMIAAVMTAQVMAPKGTLSAKRPFAFKAIGGYSLTEIAAEELVQGVLPKDTEIRRAVYHSDDRTYVVTAVISGESRSSIHRPELCLPSQGFEMMPCGEVKTGEIGWRRVDVSNGNEKGLFAYTFFNNYGYHTTSHTARIFRDVIDRSFLGRIDRWTMVTVVTSAGKESEFEQFLGELKEAVE